MRRVIAGLAILMLAVPLSAQQPAGEGQRQHRVEPGETLRDLARTYYDDADRWRVIYAANRDRLADPDRIQVGQMLVIPAPGAAPVGVEEPGLLGQPVGAGPLGVGLGEDAPVVAEARPAMVEGAEPARDPNRTVFYSPPPRVPATEGPTVLMEPGIEAYPVKPGEFISAPYVTDPRRLRVVGRFIRSLRNDFDLWGGIVTSHPQDQVYLEYVAGARPEPGGLFVLVEIGEHVPGTAEGARLIYPRGLVRVDALEPAAIEGQLEAQFGPVFPGYLLIARDPFPEFSAETAQPVAGGYDLEGRLVHFIEEKPLYGRADLGFVNRGLRDGVSVGDIFRVYLPSREVHPEVAVGETLPPEPIADVRVLRVTPHVATVRVDRLSMPQLRAGLLVRRVRKMP